MQDGIENQQTSLPVNSGFSEPQTYEKEHPDLYEQTIRGGLWAFSERIAQQVLSFVRLLILARLLPPREFGVLGIALLLLQIFETFTVTGFTAALVQRKEEDVHPFLNTAWTVNVIRGIILFILFIALAPLAINFFDGNGTFKPSDFPKPAELADRLTNPNDKLSVYLANLLPSEDRLETENISESKQDSSQAQKHLANVFNALASRQTLYQPAAFEQVPLSSYAQDRIASISPETQRRTNRLLLEQAWPGLIQNTILNRPQLAWIIRIIGIVLLFRAVVNPAIVYFTKTLRFEKSFKMNVAATSANVVVTVILAFLLKNAWALVCGFLLAEFTMLLLSYSMHPFRPRFQLDADRFRQMWRFGRWITGVAILDLLLSTGDSILVGRFLGASSLGLYQMSVRLSSLPISEFTSVIGRAAFPAFCRMQSDLQRLRDACLKITDVTSVVVMPAIGAILVFSDDIVRLFMQDTWLPMINVLRILAILGIFKAMPFGALFNAVGKPKWLTVFMVLRIALIALLFYPLMRAYGLNGVAWAVTLSGLLLVPVGYKVLSRLLECPITALLRRQAAQTISALVMVSVVLPIKLLLWKDVSYVRFSILVAAAIGVYFSCSMLLLPLFKSESVAFILGLRNQLKSQLKKVF